MKGFIMRITSAYIIVAVVTSDECKDEGLKYTAMMVLEKRKTMARWEAQMEKTFHLPWTLRRAQVMWIYKGRMQINRVIRIRAPSVRAIISLRCVSEQECFRKEVIS